MGENSHIDELLNQLNSNDLKYRQQAIDALSTHNVFAIASASLNELLRASVDSDDGMRASVAAALGKKADRGAVAVLTQRLTLDEAPKVRLKAARALGEINDPVALPALEVAFLSGDKDLSSEAALAIRRIGNADAVNILINALSHANVFIRRSAAMQVGNLGDLTVIPSLEEALQDNEASVSIAALAGIVALIGASALPFVMAFWQANDEERHSEAHRLMRKLASSHELPFLLKALSDYRSAYRTDAAEIIGLVGDTSAIPSLESALNDVDVQVRKGAVEALGNIRSAEAIPALMNALDDTDSRTATAAVNAIITIGTDVAVSGLVAALRSPHREVRYEAAGGLGTSTSSQALSALINALEDTDSLVRAAAADALGSIGDPAAIASLQELSSDDQIYETPNTMHSPLWTPPRVGTAADKAVTKIKRAHALRTIRFSACFPKEMLADTWRSAYVYLFGVNATELVAADVRAILGKDIEEYRAEEQSVQILEQKRITIKVTPRLDGFEFNPVHQTIRFLEEWHRVDFRVRTSQQSGSRTANGTIAISVNGVIVADIPFSIYLLSKSKSVLDLTVEKGETITPAYSPYGSIFCSYSHSDEEIVERVEQVCRSLGITYLRDKVSLRSGEDWDVSLLELIDRADVFQLFWSRNAAASEFVKREWEHALQLRREARRFIRPVYWTQPMPPPPQDLKHLHFAFTPELYSIGELLGPEAVRSDEPTERVEPKIPGSPG